jgi:hypothetical protein
MANSIAVIIFTTEAFEEHRGTLDYQNPKYQNPKQSPTPRKGREKWGTRFLPRRSRGFLPR